MIEDMNKKTVAILLVVAVILSVVATWKVLTSTPKLTYIDSPKPGKVSMYVEEQNMETINNEGLGNGQISLNIEEQKR